MNEEELLYNKVKEWAEKQLYVTCTAIEIEFGIGFNRAMRHFNHLMEDGIVSKTRTDEFGNRVVIQKETLEK